MKDGGMRGVTERCICGKVEECEGRRAEGERKDRCMNGQVGRWKGEREDGWKDVG